MKSYACNHRINLLSTVQSDAPIARRRNIFGRYKPALFDPSIVFMPEPERLHLNSPRFVDALLGNFRSKEDAMSGAKFTDELKRDTVAQD